MYDKALNMPLDYLNCFAEILKGILRSVDICQTDYSIYSKLRILSLFRSHTWKYNIQANKRLMKND